MRSTSRTLRTFALLGCVALGAGCTEDDDGTGPGADVFGVWELDEPETLYLEIETERITVFDDQPASDCFLASIVDIVEREGDVFTLSAGGSEFLAEITRDGDGLVIDTQGDVGTYTWVDIDTATLPRC